VDERILVLAPRGRDAALAIRILTRAGLSCHVCADLADLVREADSGAGAALVTEESLAEDDIGVLLRWLGAQPPWANLPFVVLATPRGDLAQGSGAPDWFGALGNAVLLERPLGAAELASAMQAALRDRQRQYVVRAHLIERDRFAAQLAAMNASLEAKIAERTGALRAAYDRLAEEVREREKTHALLVHSQRMEALGQLAGGIAHDFNNILQAIGGAVALIERRSSNAESVRRYAGLVLKAVERGASITNRLLAFGRISDLRAETLDAADLLSGLREILTHTLESNIEIKVILDPDLSRFRADRGQLETVLVNLATNARDAMPGGGQLSLSATSELISSEGAAHALGVAPGRYVRISVADIGAGMDAATLARACDPFFTTKPHGEGSGLGLAMAVGFVSQSGGSLRVESIPGKGTTVSLWLPAAELEGAPDAPSQRAADGERKPAVATKTDRVLVVDDEELVREALAANLAFEGFSVLTAANGTEALTLLDAAEKVDAVITDLSMPGMDGLAFIRAARDRHPGLPAVLLTGYAGDDTARAVSEAISGGFALRRKPANFQNILDTLRSLLAGREETAPGGDLDDRAR